MTAETLERSVLEGKDREQLVAIAQALGIKSVSRAKKADLVGKILEQTGTPSVDAAPAPKSAKPAAVAAEVASDGAQPELFVLESHPPVADADPSPAVPEPIPAPPPEAAEAPEATLSPALAPAAVAPEIVLGPDGEPLAEWEIALMRDGATPGASQGDDGDEGAAGDSVEGEGEASRRRRRRRRGRNRDGDERGEPGAPASSPTSAPVQAAAAAPQPAPRQDRPERVERPDRPERFERAERPERAERQDRPDRSERPDRPERQDRPERTERTERHDEFAQEPIKVAGYLDLRDEGYGFLRVNGYLPSRDDAYVPVKQSRQFGLRKGDYIVGLVRPAGRNEKNPALLEIHSVNDQEPDKARTRPKFEELTPLFPDERLRLADPSDPTNMTARIIDLVAPIGKGQRGLIVSPPKAGKTTIMKTIATAIEKHHPEVKLIVLLIDERPEEVTDMRRTVKGEVIASTFDRPSDEHTHTAELAIEKAKRLVELGHDVVVILDGITRLARAYNLVAPATGRIMSGGIDAGALYPPKKFFGAARNIEEGGSLTILATALVETNSRMDEAIFEEFKGTGNMELRLDRRLAERRVYPAIDVDASSTRHEELLFDRKQLQMVWKLRRVLSGLASDGNAAPGLELLMDRLKSFRTNDEFLNEIAKQPSA